MGTNAVIIMFAIPLVITGIVLGYFYGLFKISEAKLWKTALCFIAVGGLFLPIIARNVPLKEDIKDMGPIFLAIAKPLLWFCFWAIGCIASFFVVMLPALITFIVMSIRGLYSRHML